MSASLEITQIEILQREVLILKDTVLMLSHNIRCLNIRQGSQPFELPNSKAETVFIAEGPMDQMEVFNPENMTVDLSGITALDRMYKLGQERPELKLPDIDFDGSEFNHMVLGLPPQRPFGEDPIAWEK